METYRGTGPDRVPEGNALPTQFKKSDARGASGEFNTSGPNPYALPVEYVTPLLPTADNNAPGGGVALNHRGAYSASATCLAVDAVDGPALFDNIDSMPALSLPPTHARIHCAEVEEDCRAAGTQLDLDAIFDNIANMKFLPQEGRAGAQDAHRSGTAAHQGNRRHRHQHNPFSQGSVHHTHSQSVQPFAGSTSAGMRTPVLRAHSRTYPNTPVAPLATTSLYAADTPVPQTNPVKIEEDAPRGDVIDQVNALFRQAEIRAEGCKQRVREEMKRDLQNMQHTMSPRDRSLMRSRREARVSRVKNEEFAKALKDLIRELVVENSTLKGQLEACSCQTRKHRRMQEERSSNS